MQFNIGGRSNHLKEVNVKRVKLLIGVLSCHKYAARREACLATWANVDARDDVDLVFILGDSRHPAPRREAHLLHCPCPDDRDSLSLKTRLFCQWAIENYEFDFLFKCDDDTYVHIDRLLQCGTKGDYVGSPIPGRPHYVHPSGGAGYRLSRKAAQHVAVSSVPLVSYEDWLVWRILTNAGVQLQSDSRFVYNNDVRPTGENDQITCHWCSPDVMLEIHCALSRGEAD